MFIKKFPGQLGSLADISKYIVRVAKQACLDEKQVYEVQLAVDEAATNIIEHAYHDNEKGIIECSCEILPNGLKVILVDQGEPFDPGLVPDPIFTTNVEEVKRRGLGIYLMRRVMDEVQFDFNSDRGNTLTMVKYTKK